LRVLGEDAWPWPGFQSGLRVSTGASSSKASSSSSSAAG
jgi:hypothetical protein